MFKMMDLLIESIGKLLASLIFAFVMYQMTHWVFDLLVAFFHLLPTIGYNMLYAMSVCQIQYQKACAYFHHHSENKYKRVVGLTLFHHGKEVFCHIEHLEEEDDDAKLLLLKNMCNDYSYDLMLLNDNGHMVLFHAFPESFFGYKLSNLKFISVTINYDDHVYSVYLQNEHRNYYVVGNRFDRTFFEYYLCHYCNLNETNPTKKYTVTILDQDVNIVTLLPDQAMVLGEKDYAIINV